MTPWLDGSSAARKKLLDVDFVFEVFARSGCHHLGCAARHPQRNGDGGRRFAAFLHVDFNFRHINAPLEKCRGRWVSGSRKADIAEAGRDALLRGGQ